MSKTISVVIVDDHTIVRSGLNLLLSSEPDIAVVGEATDGAAAVEAAERLRPDVLLMDISMPVLNGFDATRQIKERAPEVSVLALTMHRTDEYFFQMLEAGASGYILKGADTNDLIRAVRLVAEGEVFLYPSMAQRLVQHYLAQSKEPDDDKTGLTPREKEILQLIAEGYANKDIAKRLVISPSTVHTHRTNIMRKLSLSTRHELVRYARDNGMI